LTVPLLSKSELSILNKRSLNYDLASAEKDYMLALVSKIIYKSSLKEKLIFKGGTAIHHCYLPQTRFSEDLDFTSIDRGITLSEVKKALESEEFLEVKKDFMSDATIKIERLKYTGPLNQPNSLKVEIDYKQNVILPARRLTYKNAWKLKTPVNVMDVREICAEKIRAASGRARYRDFYDLVLLFKEIDFNIKEIISLIRQKEIRYPITREMMLKNWKTAKIEKDEELSRIYYAHNITDTDVENLINRVNVNIGKSHAA
jgi:Uncharacterized conserved protein